MHALITGTTGSGKSVLARSLCRQNYNAGVGVLVYDPHQANWKADFVDRDFDVFCRRVNNSKNCLVVADESGDVGRHNKDLEHLATQSRHNGHDMVFISQRIQQLSVTVRENCAELFLFRSSVAAGRILSDSWICPDLEDAHTLGVGDYYHVARMGKCKKMQRLKNAS